MPIKFDIRCAIDGQPPDGDGTAFLVQRNHSAEFELDLSDLFCPIDHGVQPQEWLVAQVFTQ